MSYLPAYSLPFAAETLQTIQPVNLLESQLTREWAWEGSTGQGVKVAIIDSGIDATHPALADRGVDGYVTIDQQGAELVYDTNPHTDLYGHGTACAGIIRSFAPECELYSVRVLSNKLSGRTAVFAAGLRWAIDNGMNVCNLSLGTSKRENYILLHDLTDLACFRNVILVTAANNSPVPSYPSMFASVISVASHEVKDPYCYYYNPNPPVEFGAFGVEVRVPWLNGEWLTVTGNSFAAAHLSGLATKILGKHPGLGLFQLKVILRALATNVSRDGAI